MKTDKNILQTVKKPQINAESLKEGKSLAEFAATVGGENDQICFSPRHARGEKHRSVCVLCERSECGEQTASRVEKVRGLFRHANILIALILNLSFSAFELVGGLLTGSVAILSDSLHDLGDALSIALSAYLERKSRAAADDSHTYGYRRYSVLGGLITTLILMLGSVVMIREAVGRIFAPVEVNAHGMLLLAAIGVTLNLAAAFVTCGGGSINRKAVNLHMLEDVLGWLVVLIGAAVMRFTDAAILDPLMSIGVAVFIFCGAAKNLRQIVDLFLEKTPAGIDIPGLKEYLSTVEGVQDIHHLHVRSIDGYHHDATLHVVTAAADLPKLKAALREALAGYGVVHAVIETEAEHCGETECRPVYAAEAAAHRHHRHHGDGR